MIYKAKHIPSTILIPEEKPDEAWSTILDQNRYYWFAAVTMEEYKELLGRGQNNQHPSGQHPGTRRLGTDDISSCNGRGDDVAGIPPRRKAYNA